MVLLAINSEHQIVGEPRVLPFGSDYIAAHDQMWDLLDLLDPLTPELPHAVRRLTLVGRGRVHHEPTPCPLSSTPATDPTIPPSSGRPSPGQKGQPTMPANRAAEARSIRRLVTQQMIDENRGEVREALCLLRNLEPEMVKVASRCHAVLIRQARRDLARSGIACWGYFALITPLFNFLDGSLYWRSGRWVPSGISPAPLAVTA
jgi:hypothetical protein